ncbi:hypothetical protein [Streptomyces milbemycinicus]|uniref:Uncharacterized protein n=1 Tax=Streptomyces milbemycinicus TaxID=476552 RepID=A0ABW8M4B0_9ACTN
MLLTEIVFVDLPIDRDEVEEALDDAFEGDGEITGAGTGLGRCHLDLEIRDGLDKSEALGRVDRVLAEPPLASHRSSAARSGRQSEGPDRDPATTGHGLVPASGPRGLSAAVVAVDASRAGLVVDVVTAQSLGPAETGAAAPGGWSGQ